MFSALKSASGGITPWRKSGTLLQGQTLAQPGPNVKSATEGFPEIIICLATFCSHNFRLELKNALLHRLEIPAERPPLYIFGQSDPMFGILNGGVGGCTLRRGTRRRETAFQPQACLLVHL